MSNSNRRKSEYDVDSNKIVAFCKKNVKYISAGILTVALILVLAMTVGDSKGGKDTGSQGSVASGQQKEEGQEQTQDSEEGTQDPGTKEAGAEYEVDLPEVKELVSTYYNSYAAADVDKLDSITESLSDMEKSYIKMMNDYVESYSNVTCYTKAGKEEGSYLASATFNMKLADVEGSLPGMDFFYIRTNDKGKLYIDSLYCPFNRQMEEQKTDPEIEGLIEGFGAMEGIAKLHQDCQSEYDAMINSDEDLKKVANTMTKAIQEWKKSYDPDAEKKEAEKAAAQEEKKKKKAEKKKKEEEKKKQEEEEKKQQEEQKQQEEAAGNQEEAAPEESSGQEDNSEGGTNSSGLNYVPEGTVLTANDGYNVRVSMNESAELIGTTGIGDSITVILSYAEGWTKVEWNGQTGYIRTDLLLNN